jgi:hypothetical protein
MSSTRTNRAKDLVESTYGGILLTACLPACLPACVGKIVCDNTMQACLTLVYQELLPAMIRAILFPEDQ